MPRPGRGVITLIALNVGAWVAYVLLLRLGPLEWAQRLPLTPSRFFSGELWQPFTALILHSPGQTGHLLGNMLFLWLFGVEVEQLRGTRALWRNYLACGLGGWALVLALALAGLLLGGSMAADWDRPTLGASGAVMGITGVWGGILWNHTRHFFLLGPLQGRTMMALVAGIQLLGALSFDDSTSYAAHLGGLATGIGIGRGVLRPGMLRAWQERRRIARERARLAERMKRFDVIEGGKGQGRNDDGDWLN